MAASATSSFGGVRTSTLLSSSHEPSRLLLVFSDLKPCLKLTPLSRESDTLLASDNNGFPISRGTDIFQVWGTGPSNTKKSWVVHVSKFRANDMESVGVHRSSRNIAASEHSEFA